MLTFAIGDVHGHLDHLDQVVETCERYADGRPSRRILLGDYVDRGPDSKGVIDRVMEMTARGDVALYGNHEDMLLAALSNSNEDVRFWIDHGGLETLNSYGIDEIDPRPIPKRHTEWMRKLPLFHDDGLRFYCHAGVDPTLPLHEQRESVLVWTRDPVPSWIDLPRLIVHGHTPVDGCLPEIMKNSANLDTGAGFGGPLSAAVFDAEHRHPIALVVGGDVLEKEDDLLVYRKAVLNTVVP